MSGALFHLTLVLFSLIQNSNGRSGLRIMGGGDADENEYPYIVRLENIHYNIETELFEGPSWYTCTAAVLISTWTLTAAHCIDEDTTEIIENIVVKYLIRYGPLENNTAIEVIDIILHPSYRHRVIDYRNDIGLVKTNTILLKQYAHLSAIDFVTLVGQEVIVTGYGKTNSTDKVVGSATSLGKPLQMFDAVVIQCPKEFTHLIPAICLARRCDRSSSICPGDSGAPLIHPSGVVGITSLGSKRNTKFCSLSLSTPVYDVGIITPTSPFLDWISGILSED